MTWKSPTMFTKDAGRIRVWRAFVTKHQNNLKVDVAIKKVMFGLIGGKITPKTTPYNFGKNVGKANETTAYEQAVLDVESDMRDLHNQGYRTFEDMGIVVQAIDVNHPLYKGMGYDNGFQYLEKATGHVMNEREVMAYLLKNLSDTKLDSSGRIKPMILHHLRLPTYVQGTDEFAKSKPLHYFPVFAQPKKDGVCCVFHNDHGLITRQGKLSLVKNGAEWNDICPQIKSACMALNYEYPLHGEVFHPGFSLGDITSACKKANQLSPKLQLWIFDIVAPELNQAQRIKALRDVQDSIHKLNLHSILQIVHTETVFGWDELFTYENKQLELGEEGIVVRFPDGDYKPGVRSDEVLKLVRFDQNEVEILDILPMENERTHGMFLCRTTKPKDADHATFMVTPSKFDFAARAELLMNKEEYIGKLLTIKHRGYTEYNVPRIATAVSVRYDL